MIPGEIADAIRRQTPSRVIDNGKAELTLEQKEEKKIEDEHERRRNKAYARQWEVAEETKRRIEQNDWEVATQGRDKLLTREFQVLFRDDTCDICSSPVKYPLDGWNKNRGIRGYSDLTLAYESSEIDDQLNFTKRHSCYSDDSQLMCQYLSKKIEKLEEQVKNIDRSVDEKIHSAIWTNTVGR